MHSAFNDMTNVLRRTTVAEAMWVISDTFHRHTAHCTPGTCRTTQAASGHSGDRTKNMATRKRLQLPTTCSRWLAPRLETAAAACIRTLMVSERALHTPSYAVC